MSIVTLDERLSDSPFVEWVAHGITTADGSTTRPAESHWHMCLTRHDGKVEFFFVGPLTTSGTVTWTAGAEMLWIKFRHGTFIPKLPHKDFLDVETALPEASSQRFWLNGSAWQFPTYENADTFIEWLVRDETLVVDPLIDAVLQDEPHHYSPRTIRHRFLHATGQTQKHIRQVQRAQRAAAMLREGVAILDTAYTLGYYDQPHLTRALKAWVGYTPAQLLQTAKPCNVEQDPSLAPEVALTLHS